MGNIGRGSYCVSFIFIYCLGIFCKIDITKLKHLTSKLHLESKQDSHVQGHYLYFTRVKGLVGPKPLASHISGFEPNLFFILQPSPSCLDTAKEP